MIISILGCGWYGQALAEHLVQNGHVIKGSTTSPDKLDNLRAKNIQPYLIDLQSGDVDAAFFDCDVLVVACGADIGELPRYCEQYHIKRVIFISSTGVYGSGNVDENTVPNATKPHYLAEEKLSALPGLTVIRFAGLVGPGRLPGRFLAGKTNLPNGSSPINLIHLSDCIGLTEAVLSQSDIKLINGVSPDHPTREQFYKLACLAEGLTPPEFNSIEGEQKIVHTCFPEIYQYQVTDWLAWLNYKS